MCSTTTSKIEASRGFSEHEEGNLITAGTRLFNVGNKQSLNVSPLFKKLLGLVGHCSAWQYES